MFENKGESNEIAKPKTGTEIKKMGAEVEEKLITTITSLQEGGLKLPEGYSVANAIKYAWLKLQGTEDKDNKKVLDVCTQASIANAILAMILKGETLLYNHGYFVPYGDRLTYSEDYRGMLMRAMRDTDITDVNAQVIYKGDNFVYEVDKKGRYQFVKHDTSMENININNIIGGYAVVTYKDGSERLEIMTMEQIRTAWAQGAAKGTSMAHTKFTDQMCIRTLIKRAIKIDLGKCSETLSAIDDEEEEVDNLKAQRDEEPKGIDIPETEYEDVTEVKVETKAETSKVKKEESPI